MGKMVFHNKERVLANVRKYVEKGRIAAIQELNLIGEEVMLDSKQNYVPVKTTRLQSTGIARHAKPGDKRAKVILSYQTEYAVAVHEINKAYRGGKQWKYLTTPLQKVERKVAPRLAKAVKRAM